MSWFCYYFFCSGFAMNTLAKRMSEGRNIVYIVGKVDSFYFCCWVSKTHTVLSTQKVFLLFLTVGLIKFTLRVLILYDLQSVNTVEYTEYGPWPAETYDTNDKVASNNLHQNSSPLPDLVYHLLEYIGKKLKCFSS